MRSSLIELSLLSVQLPLRVRQIVKPILTFELDLFLGEGHWAIDCWLCFVDRWSVVLKQNNE